MDMSEYRFEPEPDAEDAFMCFVWCALAVGTMIGGMLVFATQTLCKQYPCWLAFWR